jgi:hypothetical protein
VQHSDPDVLALLALGEPAPAADTAHLDTCAQCRDEVEALARIVSTVRSDPEADAVLAAHAGAAVAPPPRVWDAIAAQTGVAVAPRPERVAAPAAVLPLPARAQVRRSRGGSRAAGPGRPARPRMLVLAVAAALVVGAAAGSVATRVLSRPSPQTVQVISQVDLTNLKPKLNSASGHASVVETKAGPRLKVDVSSLAPQPGHFYEVWLIDKSIKKMVPVGILGPGDDEFVIPDGVDISNYPVVDISVQQPGDPRHSGDSVLRGTISG